MKRFNLLLWPLLILGALSTPAQAKDCCRTECIPNSSCDVEATSKSYLFTRPAFQSASPEMVSGFRSNRLHLKEEGHHGAAQAVVYGNKSTNEFDLARYFFPFGKSELIVDSRSGAGSPPQPQDLLAQHFNIFMNDPFRSKISIRPEVSQMGLGLMARKAFMINDDQDRGFYASISFPIQRVKTDLNFQEDIILDGGTAVGGTTNQQADSNAQPITNMTEAFIQPTWDYGKISRYSDSKTGVADVELKLGYEWIQQEPFHLESYLGILIPTGNKPSHRYVFEPVVGHGHHWGLMYGSNVGIHIWENLEKERTLRVEYAMHTQYLFRNTQCRSLDLKCKPWSRYIEVYRNQDEAIVAQSLSSAYLATPGINVLTTEVKVRPGFQHNMTTAGIFNAGNWQFEGGYNLYYRQAECLKLACPWVEGPAIKDNGGQGQINPVRDMTGNAFLEADQQALINYKRDLIKQSDLDLNSASSPSVVTHTIYGTLGYNDEDREYPIFGNIGGSYEFANNTNAAVERWTVWAKLGMSY